MDARRESQPHSLAAEKQLTFLHMLQIIMHLKPSYRFTSLIVCITKLALISTLKGCVSKPYERPSVDNGEQIGFGLGNNWFAFGGDPELGFLPLDDYHLVAVIIKHGLDSKSLG